MELPAQVEVAIPSRWKPGEVDRVVGGDETGHVRRDRGVQQDRLRPHDHVPQALQRGNDARRARAFCRHFGAAGQVDAGNHHAEVPQPLDPVSRSAVPNQPVDAGATFAQRPCDAAAEMTGSPRDNDDGRVHQPDGRERTEPRQKWLRRSAPLGPRLSRMAVQSDLARPARPVSGTVGYWVRQSSTSWTAGARRGEVSAPSAGRAGRRGRTGRGGARSSGSTR